jgi:hypothetical protein
MTKKILINKVFNGIGIPEHTYVSQEDGRYERQLNQGIDEQGTLCLITGSSKTGKTTLYNKVLARADKSVILIRCDATVDASEFWKRPLEAVDFNRLKEIKQTNSTETSAAAKIKGTIGWPWLASLIGEVSLGIKGKKEESEIREAILSQPSPNHLLPLLKNSNALLVVEDFHYLTEEVQKHVFQQWKTFTDEGVSIIVVGTTHHGVDLAYANSDLIGRIQQIDLGRWSNKDLSKIITKGFNQLEISISSSAANVIASESAGLPIITQQVSAQLFLDKKIREVAKAEELTFNKKSAYKALHNVAITRYKQFESWYTRLKTGPRKGARKFNTYELMLSIFTLDPPKFELLRHEINARIKDLPIENNEIPPNASINSTLSALAGFQEKNEFELLEWSKRDQAIYIVEPAFLFYLRWREEQTTPLDIFDSIRKLLKAFDVGVTGSNK